MLWEGEQDCGVGNPLPPSALRHTKITTIYRTAICESDLKVNRKYFMQLWPSDWTDTSTTEILRFPPPTGARSPSPTHGTSNSQVLHQECQPPESQPLKTSEVYVQESHSAVINRDSARKISYSESQYRGPSLKGAGDIPTRELGRASWESGESWTHPGDWNTGVSHLGSCSGNTSCQELIWNPFSLLALQASPNHQWVHSSQAAMGHKPACSGKQPHPPGAAEARRPGFAACLVGGQPRCIHVVSPPQ